MDARGGSWGRIEGFDLYEAERSGGRERRVNGAHDRAVLNAGLRLVIGRLTRVVATLVVSACGSGRRGSRVHHHRHRAVLMLTALRCGRGRGRTEQYADQGQYGE